MEGNFLSTTYLCQGLQETTQAWKNALTSNKFKVMEWPEKLPDLFSEDRRSLRKLLECWHNISALQTLNIRKYHFYIQSHSPFASNKFTFNVRRFSLGKLEISRDEKGRNVGEKIVHFGVQAIYVIVARHYRAIVNMEDKCNSFWWSILLEVENRGWKNTIKLHSLLYPPLLWLLISSVDHTGISRTTSSDPGERSEAFDKSNY